MLKCLICGHLLAWFLESSQSGATSIPRQNTEKQVRNTYYHLLLLLLTIKFYYYYYYFFFIFHFFGVLIIIGWFKLQ